MGRSVRVSQQGRDSKAQLPSPDWGGVWEGGFVTPWRFQAWITKGRAEESDRE
jgi:hypothetical protein